MGKDMMIKILQNQLEVANATIANLNETIKSMEARFNATIDELKKTNANLESLLKECDESLCQDTTPSSSAVTQVPGTDASSTPWHVLPLQQNQLLRLPLRRAKQSRRLAASDT